MSQRPLFDFRLRPVDEVAPWGKPGEPNLHWFGLTDGCYWLNVGDNQLFRYSQALLSYDTQGRRNMPTLPYVDYYVVRLWEDLLDLLPDILEPVPDRLAHMLGPDGAWYAWEARADATQEEIGEDGEDDDDRYWAEYEWLGQATSWRHARRLNVGYLQSGPNIWLWSDAANVHIEWDNRGIALDDIPAWEATAGMYSLPRGVFLAELTTFNTRLIGEMGERVAAAQRGWSRPEVALDVNGLAREHTDRAQWLVRHLAASANRAPTDWDAVYAAIAHVETSQWRR